MTDTRCGYVGHRDDALVAYLYDDIDSAERESFEAHLGTCGSCRAELDALRGVRARLTRWAPPEPQFQSRVGSRASSVESRMSRWREIPAWAQVAAALLVLGVSAGIANVNIHYDRDGLTVRTGWLKPAAELSTTRAAADARSDGQSARPATTAPAPWRDDLAALEQALRAELRPTVAARPAASSSRDEEMFRRVRALIGDSERRQQRELALRVGQALQDVDTRRNADLARIDRTFGPILTRTGVELLKQRADINYLTVRTSQRP